jgi:hypothetical protein
MKRLFLSLGIAALLAACGSPPRVPNPSEETPLLTDADIDKANLGTVASSTTLEGLESGEASAGELLAPLADVQSDLTSQAVLPNTFGNAYYLRRSGSASTGYSYFAYRHNQQSDAVTLLYSGSRQIQSIAGSSDGKLVLLSMRQSTATTSDYEIFLLNFLLSSDPTVTNLTNDAVDNNNVSVNRSFSRIAYEEPVGGLASIIIAQLSSFTSIVKTTLTQTQAQRQPSVSGDGRQLALAGT